MKKIILISSLLIFHVTSFAQQTVVAASKATVLTPAKPEAAGFSAERLQRIDENINRVLMRTSTNGWKTAGLTEV